MDEGITVTTLPVGLSSRPEIWLIPQGGLSFYWPAAEAIMRKYPKGLLEVQSLSEVRSMVAQGMYNLWLGIDDDRVEAVLLSAVYQFAHARQCWIIWGGGLGRKYIPEGVKKVEQYCTVLEVDELHVPGRIGMERVFARYGFAREKVIMVKRFSPANVKGN